MVTDVTDYGLLAISGTAVVGVIVWGVKYMLIQAFSGKSAIITSQAGDTMIVRLQNEISRLEGIIAKQRDEYEFALAKAKQEREEEFKKLREEVAELERRIEDVRDAEIQDAADIAELTILLDAFCHECNDSASNQARVRVQSIVTRMRERKYLARKGNTNRDQD